MIKQAAMHPAFEPLITRPTSIICTNVEYDSKSAEELRAFNCRVEAFATRYLNGQSLFIQTAKLKGPFDKNWSNPWAPKKTAILELREKADRELLHLRYERAKKRRIEREVRLERSRILQADDLGISADRPVDLTLDTYSAPKNTINSTNVALVQPLDHDSAPQRHNSAPERDFVPRRHPSVSNAVPSIVPINDPAPPYTKESEMNANTENFNTHVEAGKTLQKRQSSIPLKSGQDGTSAASLCANEDHQAKPKLKKTVTPFQSHSSELEKEFCSLPTPSESENEDDTSQGRPTARILHKSDSLQNPHSPGSGGTNGFVPVNLNESSRKRDATTAFGAMRAIEGVPSASYKPTDVHQDLGRDIVHEMQQNVVKPSPHSKVSKLCVTCQKDVVKSRSMCRACYNAWYKGQRKQRVAERQGKGAARRERKRVAKRTADLPIPDTAPRLIESDQPAGSRYSFRERFALSQPESLLRDSLQESTSAHNLASSFPQPKVSLLKSHKSILRKMYPVGVLRTAQKVDEGLVNLMGPVFKQRWETVANPKSVTTTTHLKVPGADQVYTAQDDRPRKPLMTFDTPVIRREVRKKVLSNQEIDGAIVPSPDYPNLAQMFEKSRVEQAAPPAVFQLEAGLVEAVTEHTEADNTVKPTRSTTQDVGLDVSTNTILEPRQANLVQSETIVLETGLPMSQSIPDTPIQDGIQPQTMVPTPSSVETPRTHYHKLVDLHTNTLLSAEQGSLLRSLARISSSSMQDTPRQPPPPIDPMQHETPLPSTQAAMFAAQQAFREGLASPAEQAHHGNNWEGSGLEQFGDNTAPCNITPFHNITHDVGIQETQVEAQISTQALFDAFLSSQPQSNSLEQTSLSPIVIEITSARKLASSTKNITELRRGRDSMHEMAPSSSARSSSMKFDPVRDAVRSSQTGPMETVVQQADKFLGDWNVFANI